MGAQNASVASARPLMKKHLLWVWVLHALLPQVTRVAQPALRAHVLVRLYTNRKRGDL
jgi:hypothetical protein